MNSEYSDDFLRQIVGETRTIAMVGASINPSRPSFEVMQFLQRNGFRVIPVNPLHAGKLINGEEIYADLAAIPAEIGDIEMIDVFRRSQDVPLTVTDAVQQLKPRGLRTIWTQLGVANDQAPALALAAGMKLVMNRCPTVEWPRLIRALKTA